MKFVSKLAVLIALFTSAVAMATPPEQPPKPKKPAKVTMAQAQLMQANVRADVKVAAAGGSLVLQPGAIAPGAGGEGGKVDMAGAKLGGDGGMGIGGSVNVPKTAASAATVYGSAPSNDTCQPAGKGGSVQFAGFGGSLTGAGESLESCETRADAANLVYTQASPAVVKARQCMSPKMRQAFADAGQACPEPKQAASQVTTVVADASVSVSVSNVTCATATDPIVKERLCRQGK